LSVPPKAQSTENGGVTERRHAVDTAEDLARKDQELREMTRDPELLRADVAAIAMLLKLRGAFVPGDVRSEDSPDGENKQDGA